MLDGDTLVFVEVRFRRNASFGGGVASVDARKRRKLVTAARAFLHMHRGLADATCRFDVIDASGRSEEHTSELQSLMRNSYAVFRLKKTLPSQQITTLLITPSI